MKIEKVVEERKGKIFELEKRIKENFVNGVGAGGDDFDYFDDLQMDY